MAADCSETKAAIEADVRESIRVHGPDYDKKALRKKYSDLPRASFFKWRREAEERALEEMAHHLSDEARQRAKARPGDDVQRVEAAARDVVDQLPQPIEPDALLASTSIPILEKLRTVMETAESIMVFARTDDGKVRNAKLLLAGCESLRRSIETAARLQEMMMEARMLEKYHSALFRVLRDHVEPHVIEVILQEFERINAEWGVH